jgi:hypothetical protein
MPVIDLMVERIWPVAKKIVLSWGGQATEIFVLDLPMTDFQRVLNVLMERLTEVKLLRFDGRNLDRAIPLTPAVKDNLLQYGHKSTVHSLSGLAVDRVLCYFYLWTDAETRTFEVEIVFWNDASFPAGRTVVEHKRTLGGLLRMAQQVRGDHHESKCILTPEHNGDPKALLGSDEVVVW